MSQDPTLVALRCDYGGLHHTRSAILAELGSNYITDGTWRCTSTAPDASWTSVGFDDSAWPHADVIAESALPTGAR